MNYFKCLEIEQAEPVVGSVVEPVFEIGFGWLVAGDKYPRGTKLYATLSQQQAEPVVERPQQRSLTERECRAMWQASDFRGNGGQRDLFIEGIRAAEVAHGITEKQAEPPAIFKHSTEKKQ